MSTMTAADFQRLTDGEQREVAERLLKIQNSGWRPFWCADKTCSGQPHWLTDPDGDAVFVRLSVDAGPNGEPLDEDYPDGFVDDSGKNWGKPVLDPAWAHNHARQDQRLPGWNQPWVVAILSGRGSGKTTTGTEFITLCARKGVDSALIGRRGTEIVNTHVATIIARAHPDFMPIHWSSKDILEWPNGATTYLFSAEKPENIRSINVGAYWIDEAAFMDEIETVWMNIRLAARVRDAKNPIHGLVTSTPTPTEWMMKIEDDESIEVRRVSTYANRANLAPDFLAMLEKEYEGTRMGRQELHGEVLRDVEGALWNDDLFKHLRVDENEFADLVESMDDRVLAVDPAGSKGPRSDATGIIGVGSQHTDEHGTRLARSRFYVMARATIKGSPTEWAEQVFKAARLLRVNRIVAEKNFGGDMVKQVLDDYAALNPTTTCDENGEAFRITVVHATQSKETRAEATVGKYEQGTVTHVTSPTVFGDLSELEKQQVNWVPKSRGGRMPSPNDIDALVWAVRALEVAVKFAGSMATSKDMMKKLVKTGSNVGNRGLGR